MRFNSRKFSTSCVHSSSVTYTVITKIRSSFIFHSNAQMSLQIPYEEVILCTVVGLLNFNNLRMESWNLSSRVHIQSASHKYSNCNCKSKTTLRRTF
ncbi:hypothetical protein PGB90_007372 [Kerria lacca]